MGADMGGKLAVLLAVLTVLTIAHHASAQNLPKREMTITGGSFTTDAYIDVGAFTPPVFTLDDREWVGTPQMSIMCYSPSVPKKEFVMYAHMEDVVYPIIWYYPLEHSLGTWKYEYGDALTCELWECDGAPDGCDPSRPKSLPNSKAGDDLLGRTTLDMNNFQLLNSHLLNFTVPEDGKGTVGDQAGSFLVNCKGCRETWARSPSYVNPYPQYKPDKKKDAPPPGPGGKEDVKSPPPEPPSSPSSPSPPTSTPITTQPPDQSLPWREEDKVQPFDGPSQTDTSGDTSADSGSSSSGNNTLVIVLAVLGGLIGALILAVAVYFILKRCSYRAVEPEVQDLGEKDDAVARHLRIRVARPAEAEVAIKLAKGDAAMAELPWVPQTRH
jgi:hypothetical protein